ncbi:hypothetical protein BUALT_Bualt08G0044300 [Buddleja alternifolia]|uniref:Uncharacterized protein n=1 Tax=Buddleja alternifolia TaxID=168488 RepID=A0AAV6XEG2_9LAMI|nr:hypothetical protein BUALT_Bualt08G0044300 [Buddleja alternifolia]
MDEEEKRKEPSLPSDYVSLAQLQERWLQKQQEKKLKEKHEEEEKKQSEIATQNESKNHRGVKSDGHDEKLEGRRSIGDVPRRRIEKYGREIGAIDEKGKGKEIVIGGFGNGDKKKKKKKKKHYRKKEKSAAADGEKGNGAKNEKPVSEIKHYNEGFDGCEGLEIIPENEVKVGIRGVLNGENSGKERESGELKGIEESVSVNIVDVLPRNELRRGVPNVERMVVRGGYRRNGDNRGSSSYKTKRGYTGKQHTEVKLDSEKEMEDGKGYGKKWKEKRVSGDNREKDYSLKESDEVELNSGKKADNEMLEVSGEIDGTKGVERNNIISNRIEGEEGLNDNRVDMEKVENVVLMVDSGENGEKCEGGNELRRYRNWKGNNGRKYGGLKFNGWKGDNVRSRVEMNVGYSRRYDRPGRFENRRKMEQRDSGMVWVKKEDKLDAAEVDGSGNV